MDFRALHLQSFVCWEGSFWICCNHFFCWGGKETPWKVQLGPQKPLQNWRFQDQQETGESGLQVRECAWRVQISKVGLRFENSQLAPFAFSSLREIPAPALVTEPPSGFGSKTMQSLASRRRFESPTLWKCNRWDLRATKKEMRWAAPVSSCESCSLKFRTQTQINQGRNPDRKKTHYSIKESSESRIFHTDINIPQK